MCGPDVECLEVCMGTGGHGTQALSLQARRKELWPHTRAPWSWPVGPQITAFTPGHEIKRHLLLGRKVMTNLCSILKSRDITLAKKAHLVKAIVFPVWTCELDYKESWVPKNWCFWTVVLEKTPESPLDCKEIQPVNPKENQSWIFIGWTDAEAEAPIPWPPDAKSQLIWKDPDVGKDWRWEEKGTTEDEMIRWHHRLNAHEFEQAPGVHDEQGGLVCCSPWGHRVGHNWVTKLNWREAGYVSRRLCRWH